MQADVEVALYRVEKVAGTVKGNLRKCGSCGSAEVEHLISIFVGSESAAYSEMIIYHENYYF